MQILIYYVGKPRDAHANAMAAEYIKRTRRYLNCEMREIHPGRFDPFGKHPGALKVMLDAAGQALDSAGFAALVGKAELQARDLLFLIGGFEGPPPEWKQRADRLLSLSAMTYPHEFARVMLAEQIYRAATTLRGHPYPR